MRLSGTKTGSVNTYKGLGDQLYDLGGARPTLDLNFANNDSLADSITGKTLPTFTRASIGTYVDGDGVIRTSPVNLLTYSEEFSNATWKKSGSFSSSQVINAAAAPDGSITAEQYTNAASGTNEVNQLTPVSAVDYTFSIYLKAATVDDVGKYVTIGGHVSGATHNRVLAQLPAEWTRFTASGTCTAASWLFGVDGRTNGTFAGLNQAQEESTFFVWGAQLEVSTTATAYIPTTSTISGAPRFDHDPATGESLGLLIEEARTNLLTYSTDLTSSAGWTKVSAGNMVASQVSVTAPDGTGTVTQLTGGGANTWWAKANYSVTTSTQYQVSMWVKVADGGADFTAQLMFYAPGGVTPIVNGSSWNITSSWQRVTAYVTTPSSFSGAYTRYFVIKTDNTRSFYAWGAQLEEGSFPTSYIPTSGSTVTRAADVVEITGANFSSFYNQSEGTVFTEYNVLGDSGAAQIIYDFSDGTNDNLIRQYKRFGSNETQNNFKVNGSIKSILRGNTNTPFNEQYKTAYAFDGTAAQRAIKGLASSTTSPTPLPTVDQLRLGNRADSTLPATCYISRLAYFPVRLPEATLKNITS